MKKILLTNDDGFEANGLKSVISVLEEIGQVVVVVPDRQQSGMGQAISVGKPLRIGLRPELCTEKTNFYVCNGTPADCVKIALFELLDESPDIILSGINHGSNTSTNILYSGTMGAVLEGCINQIPSLGLSLDDLSPNADFSPCIPWIERILELVSEKSIPTKTCLNINFPKGEIKGMLVGRQTDGKWTEMFQKRTDPFNRDYYWLTGEYDNHEKGAKDTDEYILSQGYISIVPVHVDMTDYKNMATIKSIFEYV